MQSNQELSTQLGVIESEAQQSENKTIPLLYEKTRLETELQSLQNHSIWLQQELSRKTDECLEVKREANSRRETLESDLEIANDERARVSKDLQASKLAESRLSKEVETLSNRLQTREQDLIATKEDMEQELQEQRKIVDLQKECLDNWESRHNLVVRENEALKATAEAAAAAEASRDDQLAQLEATMKEEMKTKLQEQAKSYELKLGGRSSLIPVLPALQNIAGEEQDEPMNMTDLYSKYEEARLAFQQEQIQKKHWEDQFKNVEKDLLKLRPTMLRQSKELDIAHQKNQDFRVRLEQAIADRNDARDEAGMAQHEASNLRKSLNARSVESAELARQVQRMLVSKAGGNPDDSIPTSVEQMQTLNQQLITDNRELKSTVEKLEHQLDADDLLKELELQKMQVAKLVAHRQEQEDLVDELRSRNALYMELLAAQDKNLLTPDEEHNAVELVNKQSARSKELEDSNDKLRGELARVQSTLDSMEREKEVSAEMLARYEIHRDDLKKKLDEMEKSVLAAKGEAARAQVEASFSQAAFDREHEDAKRVRDESKSLQKSYNELQNNVTRLHEKLNDMNVALSNAKEKERHALTNLSLFEQKLLASKRAEERLVKEKEELHGNLKREGGYTDAIRRIEEVVVSRSEADKESLQNQLQKADLELTSLKKKFQTDVSNMEAKLGEREAKLGELTKSQQSATADLNSADRKLLETERELQAAESRCVSLEMQLSGAKKRLGESDSDEGPELSMQATIDELNSKLAVFSTEKDSLEERVSTYKKLSDDHEKALKSSVERMKQLELERDEAKASFNKQLEALNEKEQRQNDMIKDLSRDLLNRQQERESQIAEKDSRINQLEAEIAVSKAEAESAKQATLTMQHEVEAKSNDAALSSRNYNRELQEHAKARQSLQEALDEIATLKEARLEAMNKVEQARKQSDLGREQWEKEKTDMAQREATLQDSLEESRAQNTALLTQLEALSQLPPGKDGSDVQAAESTIVSFLQSENGLLRTQLDTATRSLERERASLSVVKRSLEEVEAERDSLKRLESGQSVAEKSHDEQGDQIKLLQDSNSLLRAQVDKLEGKKETLEARVRSLHESASPVEKREQELKSKIAVLETEKESIKREAASWQQRLESFVTNRNHIDPIDHQRVKDELAAKTTEATEAASKIKAMEEEMETQNAWKKATEQESTRMRTFAKNLKAQSDKQKKEIESLNQEKQKLLKSSANASAVVTERDDLKTKVQKLLAEAESTKTQLEGSNSQNEKLRETLRKFKKENTELKATNVSLQQEPPSKPVSAAMEAAPAAPAPPLSTTQPAAKDVTALHLPKVPAEGFRFGPNRVAVKAPSQLSAVAAPFAPGATKPPAKTLRRTSGDLKEEEMKRKLQQKKLMLEAKLKEAAEAKKKRSAETASLESASKKPRMEAKEESSAPPADTQSKAAESKDGEDKKKESTDGGDAKTGPFKLPAKPASTLAQKPSESPFAKSGITTQPAVFGQSSSLTSPFGTASTKPDASFASPSFLNMKPPGSSSAAPTFTFGKSANIQLQPPAQQAGPPTLPFGVFGTSSSGATSFGSIASGSGMRPLFGDPPQEEEQKEETKEESKET